MQTSQSRTDFDPLTPRIQPVRVTRSRSTQDEPIRMMEEILSILRERNLQLVHADDGIISFRLHEEGWKLKSLTFSVPCLKTLARDPQREIKIEYLQRDILRAAARRTTYTYPHSLRAGLA